MYVTAHHYCRVRLLSYAGTPLLLAVPSFLLSCTSGIRLLYNQRSDAQSQHSVNTRHLSYLPPQDDKFTSIPLRRQPHSKSAFSSSLDTDDSDRDQIRHSVVPAFQVLPQHPSPIRESSEPSSVATNGSVARAIPSPTASMAFVSTSATTMTAGRLPSCATARKSRYHLPFSWTSTDSRSSSESRREINSSVEPGSKSPSPLVFASPSAAATPRNSSSAERELSSASGNGTYYVRGAAAVVQGAFDSSYAVENFLTAALGGGGDAAVRKNASQEESLMMPDGSMEHNEARDHSPGGSIRWARDSDGASSIVKSELVFAAVEDGVYKSEPLFPRAEMVTTQPIFNQYRPKIQRLSVGSQCRSFIHSLNR